MSDAAHFGRWLKERRKALHLTQEDLAEQIACSEMTIRKIEAGERNPSRQLAELLAEHLNIVDSARATFVSFARGDLGPEEAERLFGRTLRALHSYPTTLPAPLTTLIGREGDLAALRDMLGSGSRLVTLTGPPGIGKTRLSIETASEASLLDHLDGGVFFVELAAIRDPAQVPAAIARVLGVKEGSGRSMLESLIEWLRGKRVLLVLDNFEQVIEAACVVADLLVASPHLRVLVTSREALRVRGERQFPVPPLEVPSGAQDTKRSAGYRVSSSLEALGAVPSVALFVERARVANPAFALTQENSEAVAAICTTLDGLPLAIELAAARADLISAHDMQAHLRERLPMLASGWRDLPLRHQTLHNAIEWSYDLLTSYEQSLFGRFGVFVGGCRPDAAEAVCRATEDRTGSVADGISSLLAKSLLQRAASVESAARFTMLETIREYALEQLAVSGETEAVRDKHAAYYLSLAEEAEPFLYTSEQKPWIDLLDRDHNNLRAALAWLLERGRLEEAMRFGAAIWRFWYLQGHLTEGRGWLSKLLALPDVGEQVTRARMLRGAGTLAYSQGDYSQARALYEEGLAIRRSLGDISEIAKLLNNLGLVALDERDFVQATSLLEECLALQRELGDKRQVALALNNLGDVIRHQHDYVLAATLLEESLSLLREIGDRFLTFAALHGLGMAMLELGKYERAKSLLLESIALRSESGVNWGIDECLEGLGGVAGVEGRPEHAARLFGAAERIRETMGVPLPPAELPTYQRHVAVARAQLDETDFAAAWEEGRAMILSERRMEQAIEYALEAD